MLCTGEKTNPGPLESILNQDPRVQAAVIFGRGRFQNGVIIDPKKEFSFDPSDQNLLDEFRDAIWPTVERMNAFAPQHSRLFKEMILVASPAKPFTYTGKGTARRPAIIADYEPEIDALYHIMELPERSKVKSPTGGLRECTRFIRDTVHSILSEEVADEVDIFQHGCDSLQAVWIRHAILRALRQEEYPDSVPSTVVFEHPSIAKLAAFLADALNGGPSPRLDTPGKIDEMHAMVAKYSADFPVRPIDRPKSPGKLRSIRFKNVFNKVRKSLAAVAVHPPHGDVVLLTGSTGGLGANVLSQLLKSKKVSKVYAFNRSTAGTSAGTLMDDLVARQRATLRLYGLDEEVVALSRCALLHGDLAAPMFGLKSELYEEIRSNVTHIIHNAWPVNFNISLSSFESNVAGLRSLVDLALTSPRPEPPRLVFISSVGVLHNPSARGLAEEALVSDPQVSVGAGYSESKFCAEQILANAARETALQPIIVRPGQLSGGPNGYWKEAEWFPALVKSGLSLQCLPDVDGTVSWIPLDKAASAVVEMRDTLQPVLHLAHPRPVPWTSVVQPIAAELRVPLVPYADWLGRLQNAGAQDAADASTSNPALQLLEFFRGVNLDPDREPLGVARMATERAVGVSATLRESLKPLGPADARKWVEVWRRRGFLEGAPA